MCVVILVELLMIRIAYPSDNGYGVDVTEINQGVVLGKNIVFFNDKTITTTSQIFNNAGSATVGDGRANVSDIFDEKVFVVSVGTRTDSGSASVHIYGWIGTTTASAGVIVYDVPVITTNNTCTTFRLDDYYYFIAAGLNTGGSGTMTGCSVRCSAVNYKR